MVITEDTAVYQDATFFVKGDKNLDSVIKDIGKLDINWREYNLIKSSSNLPCITTIYIRYLLNFK